MPDENEKFLYFASTGWKTGQRHEIEIWFVEYEGCYYCVSEFPDKSHWVRNVRHNPQVEWFMGSRAEKEAAGPASRPGTARPLDTTVDAELIAAVSKLMDAKYDWSTGLVTEICPANI